MATTGFEFAYYQNGSYDARVLKPMVMVDALNMAEGEIVEVTSQEIDNGATGSTTLLGVTAEAVDNTDDGESIRVIDGCNAVFRVEDANERFPGDTLDINGTYNGVAASSNTDLVVVEYSTASEDTLVMIITTSHIFNNG